MWAVGSTWSTAILGLVKTCTPLAKARGRSGQSALLHPEVILWVLHALPPTSPTQVAAVCHGIYDLLCCVIGHGPWPVRIWDLEQANVYMMGFRKRGLPTVAERGRMTFCTSDVPAGLTVQGCGIPYSIEWTRRSGGAQEWQWCGWHRGHVPPGRWIRVSAWVKFLQRVPPASEDFGIRVQGVVHNDWLEGLTPDEWHFVRADVLSVESEASDEVLLTFNSVPGPQTVRFADLAVEVFNGHPCEPVLA